MGAHTMQHPRDMNMHTKESSGAGMAFLIGAVIGAISGLLFAPKPGREMRDDVRRRADDMNGMAHERIEQVRDKAHSVTDKMKNKTDKTMDRSDDLEKQGKEAMERLDARASAQNKKL